MDADRLREMVYEIFRSFGVPERHAATVASCLIDSDLHGVHSHGCVRTAPYVEAIASGRIVPDAEPRIERGEGACLVIDGDNALGAVATTFATHAAAEVAAELGVGVAAVHRSNHCGAAGYYTRLAQSWGKIAMLFTSTLPTMPAAGGRDRVLGLNPWSVAVPGTAEPHFVLDTTFGYAARGRLRMYAQDGEGIPEHWATDEHGQPTTDPTAALGGVIATIGGYKGAGLAAAVGLLATALGGASFGADLGDPERGANIAADGALVVVIDPAAFGDPAVVRARADRALGSLRQCAHEPDPCTPRLPGDRASEVRAAYEAEGVRLHQSTLASLEELLRTGGTHG